MGVRWGQRARQDLPHDWIHIQSKIAGIIQIVPGPTGLAGFSYSGSVPWGFDLITQDYMPGWFEVEYETGFEFRLAGTASVAAGSLVVTLAAGVDDDGVATTPDAFTELKPGHWVVFDSEEEPTVCRVKRVVSDTEFRISTQLPEAVVSSNVTVLAYDPLMVDFVGLAASMLPLDTAGDLIIGAGISSQQLSMDGLSQSISTTSGVENSGYGARAIQYGKRLESITKQLTRHYRPINIAVV